MEEDWPSDSESDWDDLSFNNEEILLTKPVLEIKNTHSGTWTCGKCEFKNNMFRTTCMACYMPNSDVIFDLFKEEDDVRKCNKCNSYVTEVFWYTHNQDCDPIGSEKDNNDKWHIDLEKCQKDTIMDIMKKSRSRDERGRSDLLENIIKLGYSEEIMDECIRFLRWKVPMTIRFKVKTLESFFLKDTHYRSLFEIGTGNGCTAQNTRKMHETRLFGKYYDSGYKSARPKYGCFNISMGSKGCEEAISYGECYFILNDETVRWRVTFTEKDSFAARECGTLDHCYHILNKFSDHDLKNLINVSSGEIIGANATYKEIQIHGPLKFNRDIKSIMVPKKLLNNKKIKLFAEKNNITIGSF